MAKSGQMYCIPVATLNREDAHVSGYILNAAIELLLAYHILDMRACVVARCTTGHNVIALALHPCTM